MSRKLYPNTDEHHFAIDMQAYREESDKSYTACNWDDDRACNYEVTVYKVLCGEEMDGTNMDSFDASWDDKETVSHLETHDLNLASLVSNMFGVVYPDAHSIDNDGAYE